MSFAIHVHGHDNSNNYCCLSRVRSRAQFLNENINKLLNLVCNSPFVLRQKVAYVLQNLYFKVRVCTFTPKYINSEIFLN